MRTKMIMAAAISTLVPLAAVTSASATNIGSEGCTPGYWKNHTDNWYEDDVTPIPTTTQLGAIGLVPADHPLAGDSLLEALRYRGGRGVEGAERILLRAAAAAYLNAAHEGLGYPYRRYEAPLSIISSVRSAIESGDRAAMLALKDVLDAANNLGCPLN